jgi:phosphotransferase system HPr (HPr) family protein
MYSKTVTVMNEEGLHARPATQFVVCAKQFAAKITVCKDERSADAKSVMGVLTLAAGKGSEVVISAEGEDEVKAVDSLAEVVSGRG